MAKAAKALPANRVAALATFIAGLAGCATALGNAWPGATTNRIALIAGAVATMAGPLAHVVGSWLWDRTPAGQAPYLQAPVGPVFSMVPPEASPLITPEGDESFASSDFITEPYPQGEAPEGEPGARRAGGPDLEEGMGTEGARY